MGVNGFEISMSSAWLSLCLIPATAAIIWCYFRQSKTNRKQYLVSATLRFTAALAAVLILAGTAVETNNADTQTVVLVDASHSMSKAEQDTQNAVRDIENALKGQQCDYSIKKFAGETFSSSEASAVSYDLSQTNIAAALSDAAMSFGQNVKKRIIIVSDGYETCSDALLAASDLYEAGIRADAVCIKNDMSDREAQAVSLELPSGVSLGQTCEATVSITSGRDMRCLVQLYDGDLLLTQKNERLVSGANTFSYQITFSHEGCRVITAKIEPQIDTFEQNNTTGACVQISAGSGVLIVDGTGTESDALCNLLENAGYKVEVCSFAEAPATVYELCRYGLTILMNVDANELPYNSDKALKEYVEVYGRSVLTTGGENTYAYGHMPATAFDEFLPVSFEVESDKSEQPIALMLLIDNSASMSKRMSSNPSELTSPCEMARRGAMKCVVSLHKNDYVSVITFSDTHDTLVELQSLENKDAILSKIMQMDTVGGTMYSSALRAAYEKLISFDGAPVKHIVFISDGNPADKGYESIVREIANEGITLSTIAVGDDINADIMRHLSELGNGTYSKASSAGQLPSLMLSDVVRQQTEYAIEYDFTPRASAGFAAIAPTVTLPLLHGYILTELRPDARLMLSSEDESPIYAVWRYGEGSAAAFTSDLNGKWSGEWFNSESGSDAILSICVGLMPDEYPKSAIDVSLARADGSGVLRAAIAKKDQDTTYTADVTSPDARQWNGLQLSKIDAQQYGCALPLCDTGEYRVTLTCSDSAGNTLETSSTAAFMPYSQEYDMYREDSGENLLRGICNTTGGHIIENPKNIKKSDTDDMRIKYNPSFLLAILAFILFIAEIIVRRVKRI